MDTRNESQAVDDYRQHSDIYKNTLKAAARITKLPRFHKEKFQALSTAKTFSEMISIADCFDIGKVPFLIGIGINAYTSIGSLFSAKANCSYYTTKLKGDIVRYAVEKGYYPHESNNKLNMQNS
jgi:hypothetical protein